MSTTGTSSEDSTGTPSAKPGEARLEVVVLPVSDVDRAKRFYQDLGWRLDADFTSDDGLRVVQVTPRGSLASVIFGSKITSKAALRLGRGADPCPCGDIDATRADLISHGVPRSASCSMTQGGVFPPPPITPGRRGRATGPDPEGRSYSTWASFSDPDGNGWLLQEIKDTTSGTVNDGYRGSRTAAPRNGRASRPIRKERGPSQLVGLVRRLYGRATVRQHSR